MKLQKILVLSSAFLLTLAGANFVKAQDPTPQPTPGAQGTPAPKRPGTRDMIKALEEKNDDLEKRLEALEKGQSSGNGNAMDQVGPGFTREGVNPALQGGIFEDEANTTKGGVAEVYTPFNEGNEYINSDPHHFVFPSGSGRTAFRVGGYFLGDYHYFFQPISNYLLTDYVKQVDVPVPTQKDYNGFFARKAHLDFGAYFDKMFGGSIAIESDGSNAVSLGLYHCYLYAKVDKWLVFTVGKYSNPMSLESIQPSDTLPFMEASMVTNLVVNKDLGIMVSGEFNHLGDYAISLSNGAQDNESSAISPGKPEQNGKSLTMRVFFTPWLKTDDELLQGLGFGMGWAIDDETHAGSIGSSDISPAQNVPWPNGLATSLGGNEFAYDGGVGFADGTFYHWDPQAYWFAGPVGLQGEYVQSIESVITPGALTPVQLTNTAWMLEGYFDLGGKPGYDGPKIDHLFNPSKNYWGDLEFVVRVHQVIVDPKSYMTNQPYNDQTNPGTPLSTGAQLATAWGVGANWWMTDNFKLMCDFEKTNFAGGNYVDASGNSTIPSEQVVFSRAAVIF